MDVFIREWTYRTPSVTVVYPAGWSGVLPPERQIAARKARALVPPTLEPENEHGDNGDGQPARRKRRARKAQG